MVNFSAKDAMRSHMLSGEPISVLEAIFLFGVQSPNRELTNMKKDGYLIGKQKVRMAKILARINRYANATTPSNLPTKEIYMTEYWVKS